MGNGIGLSAIEPPHGCCLMRNGGRFSVWLVAAHADLDQKAECEPFPAAAFSWHQVDQGALAMQNRKSEVLRYTLPSSKTGVAYVFSRIALVATSLGLSPIART